MGVITSGILAVAGLAASGVGAARASSSANLQASLAEIEGEEQQKALEARAEELAGEQRRQRGASKVALAQGGQSDQTQPLLMQAEQMSAMNRSLAEVRRQGDSTLRKSKNLSLLAKNRGKEATLRGVGSMIGQGYKLSSVLNDYRSTTGED